MALDKKSSGPVMVILTYRDGGIKIFSADEILRNENLDSAESVIRDTDMAEEM